MIIWLNRFLPGWLSNESFWGAGYKHESLPLAESKSLPMTLYWEKPEAFNGEKKDTLRDFLGGPVVKNLSSNAGSISGWETKLHILQLKENLHMASKSRHSQKKNRKIHSKLCLTKHIIKLWFSQAKWIPQKQAAESLGPPSILLGKLDMLKAGWEWNWLFLVLNAGGWHLQGTC